MNLISRLAEEERVARELEMAAEVQRHLFPADELNDVALRSSAFASRRLELGVTITIIFPSTIAALESLSPMLPARALPPRYLCLRFRLHCVANLLPVTNP